MLILTLIRSIAVSIHAPREGCDWRPSHRGSTAQGFNSRTPGGVRLITALLSAGLFQSFNSRTPGGVRHPRGQSEEAQARFNSRTPGGVRHGLDCIDELRLVVSIHAPREGCDGLFLITRGGYGRFQFTHPGRGATQLRCRRWGRTQRFNSRTPGGVRRYSRPRMKHSHSFQFTHPGRGATLLYQIA